MTFKTQAEIYKALSNNKFNIFTLIIALMNFFIFFEKYDVNNLTITILFINLVIRDWNRYE